MPIYYSTKLLHNLEGNPRSLCCGAHHSNPRSLVVGPFGGVYVRQHVSLKTRPYTHNEAALFKHILLPQQGCSIQAHPAPTTRLLYSNLSYSHNKTALFKLILLPQQGCSIQTRPTSTTGLLYSSTSYSHNKTALFKLVLRPQQGCDVIIYSVYTTNLITING